jgi:acetyltransferase-like isoleucine patch superfamily enzyme
MYIHPTAEVQSKQIGEGTRIWQHCVVLAGARIGVNCNVCAFCFIENDVLIGDNVTIKNGVYLWDGVSIADDVMIGPGVVFTNDLRHRSKKSFELGRIEIAVGASIGGHSALLAGTRIGKYAMTGMGAVVTRDVPDYALVYGNPARFKGWIDEQGDPLERLDRDHWRSPSGALFIESNGVLTRTK